MGAPDTAAASGRSHVFVICLYYNSLNRKQEEHSCDFRQEKGQDPIGNPALSRLCAKTGYWAQTPFSSTKYPSGVISFWYMVPNGRSAATLYVQPPVFSSKFQVTAIGVGFR